MLLRNSPIRAGALALTMLLGASSIATAETCFRIGATELLDGMSYCVSSVLAPQSGNDYGPGNLFDGDNRTAWCEGSRGTAGQYVVLRISGSAPFQKLSFYNGYNKSEKAYFRNARLRTIDITTDTGVRMQEILPDYSGETVVMLPFKAQHREVAIRIVDVYPGTHYADTCLNALYVDFEY